MEKAPSPSPIRTYYALNPTIRCDQDGLPPNFAELSNPQKLMWLWTALHAPVTTRSIDLEEQVGACRKTISTAYTSLKELNLIKIVEMRGLNTGITQLPKKYQEFTVIQKMTWLYIAMIEKFSINGKSIETILGYSNESHRKAFARLLSEGYLELHQTGYVCKTTPTSISKPVSMKICLSPQFVHILNTYSFPFANLNKFKNLTDLPVELKNQSAPTIFLWLAIRYYDVLERNSSGIAAYLKISYQQINKSIKKLTELDLLDMEQLEKKWLKIAGKNKTNRASLPEGFAYKFSPPHSVDKLLKESMPLLVNLNKLQVPPNKIEQRHEKSNSKQNILASRLKSDKEFFCRTHLLPMFRKFSKVSISAVEIDKCFPMRSHQLSKRDFILMCWIVLHQGEIRHIDKLLALTEIKNVSIIQRRLSKLKTLRFIDSVLVEKEITTTSGKTLLVTDVRYQINNPSAELKNLIEKIKNANSSDIS